MRPRIDGGGAEQTKEAQRRGAVRTGADVRAQLADDGRWAFTRDGIDRRGGDCGKRLIP